MVVFVLPIIFTLKLRAAEMTLAEKIFGMMCIITGLVGGAFGSYEALSDIIIKVQNH